MKILGGLFLCLGLALHATAQDSEKSLTSLQFNDILSRGIILVLSKPYRKLVVGQTITQSDPPRITSEKGLFEFDAAHNGHILQTFTFPKESRISESFIAKGQQYRRENGGAWSLLSRYTTADRAKWNEKLGDDAPPRPVNRNKIISDERDCKYFGETTLNDKPVRVFGYTQKTKSLDELKNVESSSVTEAKFWFGTDGALLKEELKTDRIAGEITYHTQQTVTYEIIPDLKVEIPAEVESLINAR